MNYSSSAPVKQTVPLVADLPGAPNGNNSEKPRNSVDNLRLIWENRRALLRVALYALLASAGIAFIISPRYQSTAHLMPPDGQSNSGLAMAAAAMAGSVCGGALGGGGPVIF